MKSVVGIFNSLNDAKRAIAILRSVDIQEKRIGMLAPGAWQTKIEAALPTIEAEQPGMGKAIGGTVGGAIGVATGVTAGAAAANLLMPGVGPVLVFGLIGAALLGGSGATAGAFAGEALEEGIAQGLPHDELYVYEDALRRGRTIVIALVEDEAVAEEARTGLSRAGAESVDAARHEWWIGLRDAEREHYTNQGGDFKIDEATYRLGFEAAMHPARRDRTYEQAAADIERTYGVHAATKAFRNGYERGLRYSRHIRYLKESSKA